MIQRYYLTWHQKLARRLASVADRALGEETKVRIHVYIIQITLMIMTGQAAEPTWLSYDRPG